MSLALRDIVRTVLYCENDPHPRAVLKARMADGSLHHADIHDDLNTLADVVTSNLGIDIILAGWPCQDLSSMGKGKGLEGERSGLIKKLLDVVDKLGGITTTTTSEPTGKLPALFLENVDRAWQRTVDFLKNELCLKRGYTLHWVVYGASEVGAPHERKRWFALCLPPNKPVFQLPREPLPTRSWSPEPDTRMIKPTSAKDKTRLRKRNAMLGNSVVPAQARAAFNLLLAMAYGALPQRPYNATRAGMPFPQWGRVLPNGAVEETLWRPLESTRSLDLVFDPRVFKGEPKRKLTSPLVTEPISKRFWATPRAQGDSCANKLTERALRDLASQIRFEVGTREEERKMIHPSPLFLEWMMGYPAGWTDVGPRRPKLLASTATSRKRAWCADI